MPLKRLATSLYGPVKRYLEMLGGAGMSALPPRTDILSVCINVCEVPLADMCGTASKILCEATEECLSPTPKRRCATLR